MAVFFGGGGSFVVVFFIAPQFVPQLILFQPGEPNGGGDSLFPASWTLGGSLSDALLCTPIRQSVGHSLRPAGRLWGRREAVAVAPTSGYTGVHLCTNHCSVRVTFNGESGMGGTG